MPNYSPFQVVVEGNDSSNWFLQDAAGSSFIFGYGGVDVITAHATDLYLGPGSIGFYDDYFDGGEGDYDVVNYELSTTAVEVDLALDTAWRLAGNGAKYAPDHLFDIESAWGSHHGDKLKGNALANQFNGFDGDDQIWGRDGNDWISGGGGDDFVNGGADDDFVEGNAGDDRVIGGAGDDVVNGGPGADDVWGGTGADAFAYTNANSGTDTIHDFELGVDRFAFAEFGFFAEPLGNGVELSDVLGALSAAWLGGDPDDSLLIANTTQGLQTIAVVKDVSAADMLAAIADESILGTPPELGLGFDLV
ncbi:MAG: hypothetical protein AAFX81_06055 [Pseudomonadota bacterium]